MAIGFSALKGKLRTINVNYLGDNVAITYRPGEMTPRKTSEIVEQAQTGEVANPTVELLLNALVSWEIVDDQGKELPVTRELLEDAPGPFLNAISEAIGEDARPKTKSAGKSFAR